MVSSCTSIKNFIKMKWELILFVLATSVYCYPSSEDCWWSFTWGWSSPGPTLGLNLTCCGSRSGVLRFLYAENDTLLRPEVEEKRNITRYYSDRCEEATVAGIPQNLDNTLIARCLPEKRRTSCSQEREDYVISYPPATTPPISEWSSNEVDIPTTASTNSDTNIALGNAITDFTDASTNKSSIPKGIWIPIAVVIPIVPVVIIITVIIITVCKRIKKRECIMEIMSKNSAKERETPLNEMEPPKTNKHEMEPPKESKQEQQRSHCMPATKFYREVGENDEISLQSEKTVLHYFDSSVSNAEALQLDDNEAVVTQQPQITDQATTQNSSGSSNVQCTDTTCVCTKVYTASSNIYYV